MTIFKRSSILKKTTARWDILIMFSKITLLRLCLGKIRRFNNKIDDDYKTFTRRFNALKRHFQEL